MKSHETSSVLEPSDAYFDSVDASLVTMFNVTAPAPQSYGGLPKQLTWKKDGYMLAITETKIPQLGKLLGITPNIGQASTIGAILNRFSPIHEGYTSKRTYFYTERTLQVVNSHLSLESGEFSTEQNESTVGIHVPSEEEYRDFIDDLKSYSPDKARRV